MYSVAYTQYDNNVPAALGNGSRIMVPISMENHLLDESVSHLVDNAIDAIIFESWRFYD